MGVMYSSIMSVAFFSFRYRLYFQSAFVDSYYAFFIYNILFKLAYF